MIRNGVYTERLIDARLRKRLYQKDMAKKLGYNSITTYSNIENGKTNPTLSQMNGIAEILEKPVSYFFNLKDY